MFDGMIYNIFLEGGPRDGEVMIAFRPYDTLHLNDDTIYATDEEGEACLEWAGDEERNIRMKFRGHMTMDEYLENFQNLD